MKYIEKRETKPLECDNQVSVHLLPPDLERPDQAGDPALSKSAIWVGEEDFYGGVVQSTEPAQAPAGDGESENAAKVLKKVLKAAKSLKDKDPNYKLPKELAEQLDAHVILGFDTEYKSPPRQTPQEIREGKILGGIKNSVLSYQFYAITNTGVTWSNLCCPDTTKGLEGRMKLGEFIVFALGLGVRNGLITKIPEKIYLVGHFTRADVPSFGDFQDLTSGLSNVRNTFSTTDRPIDLHIRLPGAKFAAIKVFVRDTMLLTPQSSKNLRALGELVGLPKMNLDDDPEKDLVAKENMDVVRRTKWPLFRDYAIRDAEICARYLQLLTAKYRDLTGNQNVPATLTGIGVELLTNSWVDDGVGDPDDIVGKEKVTERVFSKHLGRYTKETRTVLQEEVYWFRDFAVGCYHGGRNEQFWFGPSYRAVWTDYDLSSAYPTAMSLIGKADWRNVRVSMDPDEYTPDRLGFACVDFEFPASVRYPSLPIRTDNGLIFPLRGRSYCSTPEIDLARRLGAHVTIRFGVIVPSDDSTPVFRPFIVRALAERAKFKKGTLDSNFWKELANSTYGKTAQGLQERRVFDLRDRDTAQIPESAVTNPFFAAYITSFVRGVMGEIMNSLPVTSMVFSCTTDGFLTDALEPDVQQAARGPLATMYSQQRAILTGKPGVLEIKHQAKRLLGWRTRGQATLEAGDVGEDSEIAPIVLAKGGITLSDKFDTDALENAEILRLFFNRTEKSVQTVSTLAGMREIVQFESDLVPKEFDRKLSMEYDWKRAPHAVTTSRSFDHIAFSTHPWETVEHFRIVRDVIEKDKTPPIKTQDDFYSLYSSIETSITVKKEFSKNARKQDRAVSLLRKNLCAAWHTQRELFGDLPPRFSASALASAMNNAGMHCTRHDVENGKKPGAAFNANTVPVTDKTENVVRLLKEAMPGLATDQIFVKTGRTPWVQTLPADQCPFISRVD